MGTSSAPERRLRGRLPVLWRGADEVQVGTDPRWALGVSGLPPAAARALSELPAGADRRAVVTTLRRAGAPEAATSAVVAHLTSAELLVACPPPGASPDEQAWALLAHDADGARVLRRRARAVVGVRGLGRVGTGVAAGLAGAGVGTLVLEDAGHVTRHDVGASGLRDQDVGRPRADAVARLLRDVAPDVRTSDGEPDLVVVVEHHVADPVGYALLHEAGRSHLSVVVREASALVGPLVVPGRTGCLRCVDLERTARDDRWPTLAAQLARAPAAPEETTLALATAALATAQALAHVDGRPVTVHDASLLLRLPDVLPHVVAWPRRHECGCTAPDPVATG
ncbi:ThiF family adenylyltransferase [Actinotalea sp. JY-7876]|uniref:ThiF family adenylyltransferase n=2 Tax=unclassified Actinotalea TaxID=2638618 RepID=UPI0015F561C9|nr:ThiF family adenylyltransferase [Actinotalea sp. JY-7876]